MKKKVKIILIAALCVLGAAGVIWHLSAPLQVELVEILPQTAQLTFTEEGVFDYSYTHAIFPMISGEVLEVLVREGDRVRQGDVIAVINASDYQRQIEQLRSTVRGLGGQIHNLTQQEQAEMDALRGQRRSLQGQLFSLEAQAGDASTLDNQILFQQSVVAQHREAARWAQRHVEYMRGEFGRGSPEYYMARQQLSQARGLAEASQVQLEALRASDAGIEGQRQSIEAQIDAIDERLGTSYIGGMITYFQSMIESTNASIAQMEEQMGRAEIIAPVSGRITSLPVADVNLVSAGNAVAVIGFEEIIEVYIPTRELEGVSVGDQVELILDRRFGSQTIGGRVVSLGNMAEVRLSALGVEERRVRALIQPQANDLIIGYAMDVRFTVLSLPDSLIVPKTAVFRLDGEDHLWVLDENGRAALRQVTRGVETRDGFVITDGLSAGEQVVRDANQEGLSAGTRLAR